MSNKKPEPRVPVFYVRLVSAILEELLDPDIPAPGVIDHILRKNEFRHRSIFTEKSKALPFGRAFKGKNMKKKEIKQQFSP